MTEHLRYLNVIPHNHLFDMPVLECDLILNRLYQYVDANNEYLKICPLHRYTFGIGWRAHNRCYHMDHNITFQESNLIKRRSASETKMRVAPFHLAEKIIGFPYGGTICDKHRKQLYREVNETIDDLNANYMNENNDMETISTVQSFTVHGEEQHRKAQRILAALDHSPIKSQTRTPLLQQTPGAIRRLAAKLRKSVAAATATFASSLAPDEVDLLIDVSILVKHC